MITLNSILLCDDFSQGQFQKCNLIGWNVGGVLAVNKLPYTLRTVAVVIGKMEEQNKIEGTLSLSFRNCEGKETITHSNLLENELPEVVRERIVIFAVELPIRLTELGELTIKASLVGAVPLSVTFPIKLGDSPNIAVGIVAGTSSILSGSSGFSPEVLFHIASRDIVIIDQYFDPDALIDALSVIPPAAQIRVLAAPGGRLQAAYRADPRISALPSRISIRFGRDFHDRFVIINDTECYHFGHSLKDLAGGRISRYSKITDQTEVNELKNQFAVAWSSAAPL